MPCAQATDAYHRVLQVTLTFAESNSTYKNTGAVADLYTSDRAKGARHFFDAAGEATWVIFDPSTGAQVPPDATLSSIYARYSRCATGFSHCSPGSMATHTPKSHVHVMRIAVLAWVLEQVPEGRRCSHYIDHRTSSIACGTTRHYVLTQVCTH